jgi:hypothetical protein
LTREIIIHDARGKRTCSSAGFPLRIGEGAEADIRLPGFSGDAVHVFLGISDGHVFAQPAGDSASVYLNEQPLGDSHWLAHGDTLRVVGTNVRFEAGATTISFVVDVEIPRVVPPEEPPPVSTAVEIEPVALKSPSRAPAPRSRTRVWSLIALATFVALALTAGFVFLAVPVSIRVTPTPETLTIKGLLPSVEVGERRLLIPGSYRVRVTRTGYRPLDEMVDVAGPGHQEIELTLEKLPGLVTIESRPVTGARVSIDGEQRGRTPLRDMELSPGTHEILLTAERYSDASLSVEVEGLGNRQGVSIELTPRWAVISMASVPPGARVLLDGVEIGETPLDAEILEGSYRLEVARTGFDTVSTTLNVIANQARRVAPFELVESDGVLSLESKPSGATVSVAGKFRGRTPLELSLAPRVGHALRLSLVGFETLERQVSLDPAASEKLLLTLQPQYGSVFITAQPADAELYVDGKRHGTAGGRIRLTTRQHALEFRKEGYQSFETTVTPRAGVSQQVSVRLQTTEAAKRAARKPQVETAAGQVLRLVEPKGRFLMGASRREQGRRANETARLVELTRPFYLGVKEVSNSEYRRFAAKHSSGAVAGKSLDDASQPVARVTWEDAVRYLNWLSAEDSLPPAYRAEGKTLGDAAQVPLGQHLPTHRFGGKLRRPLRRRHPAQYPARL